jgi:membrane protein involved in colicin uptake
MEEDDKLNKLKLATIILGIIVVALGIVLVYISVSTIPGQKSVISALNTEKDDLMIKMQTLRAQYDDLKTDNDTLNAQLEVEKQKVDMMIERLKQTEITNRARIREYEKELGTLRDVMRGYIRQIDSLNTLNTNLRRDATIARAEARASDERYQDLVQTAGDLAQKLEKGAVVKARDIKVSAINEKGKEVTKAINTKKLRTCATLIENNIAEAGPRSVFVRVKGPDGILMTPSENNIFRVEDGQLIYSAVREVDYQGQDIEVCVFYGSANEKFAKGAYTVDVFSGGALLGSGQVLLK